MRVFVVFCSKHAEKRACLGLSFSIFKFKLNVSKHVLFVVVSKRVLYSACLDVLGGRIGVNVRSWRIGVLAFVVQRR